MTVKKTKKLSTILNIVCLNVQSPDREFLLRVSYMEIYNEKITDLLDPEEKTLKMLEDEVCLYFL